MRTQTQEPKNKWEHVLTPEEYRVLREKGTEPPFSGSLLHEERSGVYRCAACGSPLFTSESKFDSKTGWPSFDLAIPGSIEYEEDFSGGMYRIEVMCGQCKSHLGHVFDDGPTRTKMRYCINSLSLMFEHE